MKNAFGVAIPRVVVAADAVASIVHDAKVPSSQGYAHLLTPVKRLSDDGDAGRKMRCLRERPTEKRQPCPKKFFATREPATLIRTATILMEKRQR